VRFDLPWVFNDPRTLGLPTSHFLPKVVTSLSFCLISLVVVRICFSCETFKIQKTLEIRIVLLSLYGSNKISQKTQKLISYFSVSLVLGLLCRSNQFSKIIFKEAVSNPPNQHILIGRLDNKHSRQGNVKGTKNATRELAKGTTGGVANQQAPRGSTKAAVQ